jgi:uncharacterized OB-fold protein
MTTKIPIVNYLAIDNGPPHLVAQECEACGARFLSKRLACARCGARRFQCRPLPRTGKIGSFSIIYRAARGVATPFVSVIVDLDDGTTVKSNLVGCEPDPKRILLNMPVELTTFEAGVDDDAVTAIAFGFTPYHPETSAEAATPAGTEVEDS